MLAPHNYSWSSIRWPCVPRGVTQNNPHDSKALVSNGTPSKALLNYWANNVYHIQGSFCHLTKESGDTTLGMYQVGSKKRKKRKTQARSIVPCGRLSSLSLPHSPRIRSRCWKQQTAVLDRECALNACHCGGGNFLLSSCLAREMSWNWIRFCTGLALKSQLQQSLVLTALTVSALDFLLVV